MLNSLNIIETNETPNIIFDINLGLITIEGVSIPLIAINFYDELIFLLREFLNKNPKKITFNCHLKYFNTGTSRCLLTILNMLMKYNEESEVKLIINWYYDDEEILECGEDYAYITSLKFNFIKSNLEL